MFECFWDPKTKFSFIFLPVRVQEQLLFSSFTIQKFPQRNLLSSFVLLCGIWLFFILHFLFGEKGQQNVGEGWLIGVLVIGFMSSWEVLSDLDARTKMVSLIGLRVTVFVSSIRNFIVTVDYSLIGRIGSKSTFYWAWERRLFYFKSAG